MIWLNVKMINSTLSYLSPFSMFSNPTLGMHDGRELLDYIYLRYV